MKKKFGRENAAAGHMTNSETLPDGRNAGQKNFLSIQQNCVPAPGSPMPTQAPKGARGIIRGS